MKHIFDKDFVYVPANKTDIRARFDRIRKAALQGTASGVRADSSEGLKPNAPAGAAPKVLSLRKGRA